MHSTTSRVKTVIIYSLCEFICSWVTSFPCAEEVLSSYFPWNLLSPHYLRRSLRDSLDMRDINFLLFSWECSSNDSSSSESILLLISLSCPSCIGTTRLPSLLSSLLYTSSSLSCSNLIWSVNIQFFYYHSVLSTWHYEACLL